MREIFIIFTNRDKKEAIRFRDFSLVVKIKSDDDSHLGNHRDVMKKFHFIILFSVASPPDRRITKDDNAVPTSAHGTATSASALTNTNASTSCTGGSPSTTHSHNPPSPGRNGQLSSKLSFLCILFISNEVNAEQANEL